MQYHVIIFEFVNLINFHWSSEWSAWASEGQ